jgi:anti-sigma regulatory factor (Ser/Thr protein kinase)
LKSLPPNIRFESEDAASNTIERIFRRTHMPQSQQPINGYKKNKIRSTSSKQLETPAVGFYDAVDVADKMKYKKSREVVFSSTKRTSANHQASNHQPTSINRSGKLILYH